MDDEKIMQIYKELQEHYGDNLVNHEYSPKQFKAQLEFYLFYKYRNEYIKKEEERKEAKRRAKSREIVPVN